MENIQDRNSHEFNAGGPQLFRDAFPVRFDGLHTDAQAFADRDIHHPAADEPEDVELAAAEHPLDSQADRHPINLLEQLRDLRPEHGQAVREIDDRVHLRRNVG